jgi:hypothetical protein
LHDQGIARAVGGVIFHAIISDASIYPFKKWIAVPLFVVLLRY